MEKFNRIMNTFGKVVKDLEDLYKDNTKEAAAIQKTIDAAKANKGSKVAEAKRASIAAKKIRKLWG